MVRPFGAQTDAGSIRKPQPAAFRLVDGNFQPLAPPDALAPFVVDDPASRRSPKLCDLPIAIAAVPAGEFNDVGGQPLLFLSSRRNTALRRTLLPKHATQPSFGQFQLRSNMADAGTATRGAQKFPFAASARIILSSVRSETARRSRAFSASSSFIRFTRSVFSPPNSRRHLMGWTALPSALRLRACNWKESFYDNRDPRH